MFQPEKLLQLLEDIMSDGKDKWKAATSIKNECLKDIALKAAKEVDAGKSGKVSTEKRLKAFLAAMGRDRQQYPEYLCKAWNETDERTGEVFQCFTENHFLVALSGADQFDLPEPYKLDIEHCKAPSVLNHLRNNIIPALVDNTSGDNMILVTIEEINVKAKQFKTLSQSDDEKERKAAHVEINGNFFDPTMLIQGLKILGLTEAWLLLCCDGNIALIQKGNSYFACAGKTI